VSNCQSGYIEAFLDYYNLKSKFQGWTCYGDTKMPKADNIATLTLQHKLSMPIYVGDTLSDYEATLTLGIPFVWAEYGFGTTVTAGASIRSPLELLKVLPRMENATKLGGEG
jgi:phosphoglycolate phosphatase